MTFFRITPSFTKTASDYITRDAVERANEQLRSRRVLYTKTHPSVDVYAHYNIERPTIEQIAEAGTRAMRDARLGQAA